MNHYKSVLHLALFFLLVSILGLGTLHPVQAGTILTKNNMAVQVNAHLIRFSVEIQSDTTIDKVSLLYGTTGHGCLSEDQEQVIAIAQGSQVHAAWQMDLGDQLSFLPGMGMWYQWQIQDASGAKLETERQVITLTDPRFQWQTQAVGQITLHWARGGESFGKRMMDIAVQSLDRLANSAGVKTPEKLQMYIYPSVDDLRAVSIGLADWAGGVAFGEYNVVLIGIAPDEPLGWPEEVIPHELAHLITQTGFTNCAVTRLPLWLMEGIAQYAEGSISRQELDFIQEALQEDRLPALKSLAEYFPQDAQAAASAYAQSRVVVMYLIDTYGVDKMNQLIESIRGGQNMDGAMRPIYGLNTDELDRAWRASEGYGEMPQPHFATETAYPTRTPFATMALRANIWTPEPSATITPLPPTDTPVPTRTPIPPTSTSVPSQTPTLAATAEIQGSLFTHPARTAGIALVGLGLMLILFLIVRKR